MHNENLYEDIDLCEDIDFLRIMLEEQAEMNDRVVTLHWLESRVSNTSNGYPWKTYGKTGVYTSGFL